LPCSCQQIRHVLTTTNPEHSYIQLQEGQYELTVASLEDKVLQRAVAAVLNAVYEAGFKGFSYGFRPGRSQHDALDALSVGLGKRVNWVLDADIRGFLDPWSYCSFADCAC
jgi:RNA-directed DNA polymerase